jgi:hypothetical protein
MHRYGHESHGHKHHSTHGHMTAKHLSDFLAKHHLNLYTGRGKVWDESGRVLGGGKATWWAKLVRDTGIPGKPGHEILGTGRTMQEALDEVLGKAGA